MHHAMQTIGGSEAVFLIRLLSQLCFVLILSMVSLMSYSQWLGGASHWVRRGWRWGLMAVTIVAWLMLASPWSPWVKKQSVREYEMTWQVDLASYASGEAEVILTFESFPGHRFRLMDASNLAIYLQSLPAEHVRVRIPVLTNYGRVTDIMRPQVVGFEGKPIRNWQYTSDHPSQMGLLDWWYNLIETRGQTSHPSPWQS